MSTHRSRPRKAKKRPGSGNSTDSAHASQQRRLANSQRDRDRPAWIRWLVSFFDRWLAKQKAARELRQQRPAAAKKRRQA